LASDLSRLKQEHRAMNPNLTHLVQACDALGVAYTIHHSSGNLIEVNHDGQTHLFVNWTTPFNSHAIAKLCTDKEYFYRITHTIMPMPPTIGYVNPSTVKYHSYVAFPTIEAITNDILAHFDTPVIIKMNRGTTGINVFCCTNREEIQQRLEQIYNRNSSLFDYVALAQQYIAIQREYRVIYLDGVLQFAYEKNVDQATFNGNLSRLHWDGARALMVDDDVLLAQIDAMCKPLFARMPLRFCGLDVAQDVYGRLWLIEANSSPGFDVFIRDGGGPRMIELYQQMLRSLFNKA
jgi:glutathione synthase/RimK-type ligase-like ATP-grasp enzyme